MNVCIILLLKSFYYTLSFIMVTEVSTSPTHPGMMAYSLYEDEDFLSFDVQLCPHLI